MSTEKILSNLDSSPDIADTSASPLSSVNAASNNSPPEKSEEMVISVEQVMKIVEKTFSDTTGFVQGAENAAVKPIEDIVPVESNASPHEKHQLSENWKWVLDIIDEAHFPHLGLPAEWHKTQRKDQLIAYDPKTKQQIDTSTGRVVKTKQPPVRFIRSTKGKNPIPGTQTPAVVKYQRYIEGKLHEHMFKDPASGDTLIPCIAHGDYVQVEALQSDHAFPKEKILKRQQSLVEELNTNSNFAAFLMSQDGMDKFFINYDNKYYGTLYFYKLYFNDIDNIWLICNACNLNKSNDDVVNWFEKQWAYGNDFIDYIGEVNDNGIIARVQNRQGIAEVAINWYWKRHAVYSSFAKKLLEDVITPVRILNKKIDRVIGVGHKQQSRATRLQTTLEFKLALMESIINSPKLGMRKLSDEPSTRESSNSQDRLEGNYTHSQYKKMTEKVVEKFPVMLNMMASEVLSEVQKEDMIEIAGSKKRKRGVEPVEQEQDFKKQHVNDSLKTS